jgi:hypothetical protein
MTRGTRVDFGIALIILGLVLELTGGLWIGFIVNLAGIGLLISAGSPDGEA